MGTPPLASSLLAGLSNQVVLAQDEFIGSFWFFALGALVLVGLGGLLYYLRNKREED